MKWDFCVGAVLEPSWSVVLFFAHFFFRACVASENKSSGGKKISAPREYRGKVEIYICTARCAEIRLLSCRARANVIFTILLTFSLAN